MKIDMSVPRAILHAELDDAKKSLVGHLEAGSREHPKMQALLERIIMLQHGMDVLAGYIHLDGSKRA